MIIKHQKPASSLQGAGFALIATISVMVLLVMIALAMLSLSTIEMRSSSQGMAQAEARANARMALMLAIGELQKHAGRDQRITATARISDEEQVNPHWSGVWSSKTPDSLPIWLVSGNELFSVTNLDSLSSYPAGYHKPVNAGGDYFKLFSKTTATDKEVRVPTVDLSRGGGMEGRYAWWISDEGSKAQVDLATAAGSAPSNYERIARASSPRGSGIVNIDGIFEQFTPDSTIPPARYVSTRTTEFNLKDNASLKQYLHALTTGGFGLPVNVRTGKMKTDLSLVFDDSSDGKDYDLEYMGAEVSNTSIGLHDFDVKEPSQFYFVDELTKGGTKKVGPNWGILYSYGKLASFLRTTSGLTSTQMPSIPVLPKTQVNTDIRTNDWAPYNEDDKGSSRRDLQHTSSPVTAVSSHLQMGFRLKARGGASYVDTDGTTKNDGYQLQLEIKPVVGLWNPYNVKIKNAKYEFNWALFPYLRLGITDPTGTTRTPSVWMREHWLAESSVGGTKNNQWFSLSIPSVDLEPGEFRLFSIEESKGLAKKNTLTAGWNETGAFTFDLVTSKVEAANSPYSEGAPIVVKPGSVAWYEDLFIEDAQHEETDQAYPTGFLPNSTASWFTLVSGEGSVANSFVHRVSDLWLTPKENELAGTKRDFYLPDQVISDDVRSGASSPKVAVEQLAVVPWHIGTWSWSLRTTADIAGTPPSNNSIGTQALRGWVDSNPRYVTANPRWDGSRLSASGGYDGWYFISPMIGGSNPDLSWNGYDGSSSEANELKEIEDLKGRGMISIGQLGDAEPQASGAERYRGYGGNSTTANGQTHTAIFDVPRTGLVSIGQLQHAQLSRYNYEPGFIVGNSYANVRIPLGQTSQENFNGFTDFTMADTPYHANETLWDDFFFSTIGIDYHGGTGTLNELYKIEDLRTGEKILPNPRYKFMARAADETMEDILDAAGRRAPEALASRIHIQGAFNVNSTSKSAWKAILSSMTSLEFPVISENGDSVSWETPQGARIPRFSGFPLGSEGWDAESATSDNYWKSYRRINPDELDALAEEIVKEVKKRGPFRSLAEFVNRNPKSLTKEDQLSGALQTALDATLNNNLPADITADAPAVANNDNIFSEANQQHSQAIGTTSYALQGDILQALGPILQVRSDYFRIRTMGESTDKTGAVIARAYCEAYVQRFPDYLDNAEPADIRHDDLTSNINRHFGRRFRIVSFRWLSDSEI